MKAAVAAFFAGVLFAVGLAVAGMTDPAKILSFLDVAGQWDPALMFVMAAALSVYAPLSRVVRARRAPIFAPAFSPLSKSKVDAPLVTGSVLFGVGWGVAGWCPGPALASVFTAAPSLVVFVGSMMGGFVIHDFFARKRPAPVNDVSHALR